LGAQCASTASAAHSRRCSRLSRIYSFSHRDRPGRNSLRLTGRYGHRWLAPGKYVLAVIGFTSISFTVHS